MDAAAPVLAVENLRIAAGASEVVSGVGFSVVRGEIRAVVGESGSGKTMVARSILSLLPPGVALTGGSIHFESEAIEKAGAARLRRLRGGEIGMVFQEPMVSLNPAHRIGAQMEEGLRIHRRGMARSARRALIGEMLRRVGITDVERCLAAHPHEFSGGMRQRMMLASVMMLKPKLLIADEPTTALDSLTQKEVLDLLIDLTRESGTAVLLITHDLGVVSRYADSCVVLEQGRLVEAGPTAAVIERPREAYTRRLVDAIPAPPLRSARATGAPGLLRVRDLKVTFRQRRGLFARPRPVHALAGVSLDLSAGETVAVVGASGSGKTTFGRAILQLVRSAEGEISFDGHRLVSAGQRAMTQFRLACQLVSQDPYSSLDPRMRVFEIVGEALRMVPGLDAAERRRRIAGALDEVGLGALAERLPHQLSGGQRQRVAIARALVRRPRLVVADEPVSALDMTIQKQILDLFAALQRSHGFSCLFISHDLAVVRQIADRVIVMKDGLIVEEGEVEHLYRAPQHPYTRLLLDASPGLQLSRLRHHRKSETRATAVQTAP
jgi:peptide/nickel transport system ATP-binding protein